MCFTQKNQIERDKMLNLYHLNLTFIHLCTFSHLCTYHHHLPLPPLTTSTTYLCTTPACITLACSILNSLDSLLFPLYLYSPFTSLFHFSTSPLFHFFYLHLIFLILYSTLFSHQPVHHPRLYHCRQFHPELPGSDCGSVR